MSTRLYKPVAKAILDFAVTNVTTAAYVEMVASTNKPCSALEIFNGGGSILKIALGAAASEVDMNYYILPGGSQIILPIEIPHSTRISLKAVDTNSMAGSIVLNFLG